MGDECAYVAEAHYQECPRLQKQIHVEVVLALEVEIVYSAEHQEPSGPHFQEVHPAIQQRPLVR